MFKKVLIPTDFSQGYNQAIENFSKKNAIEIEELLILHVIDEDYLEDLMNGYSLLYKKIDQEYNDIMKHLQDESNEKIEKIIKELKTKINAKVIKSAVRVGKPFEEIVKFADEENVSLILLPSHGKLSFSHEILGSTTIRVLRKTKKPVLLIKTIKE